MGEILGLRQNRQSYGVNYRRKRVSGEEKYDGGSWAALTVTVAARYLL